MTDNEIIKALKYCNTIKTENHCTNCPFYDYKGCTIYMLENAVALINRQNKEIDRLTNELHGKVGYIHEQVEIIEQLKQQREMLLKECKRCGRRKDKRIRKLKNQLKTAREKAIKEFAERLKERFYSLEYKANTKRTTLPIDFVKDQMEWIFKSVSTETIDNLVKEMTESEG